MHKIPDKPAKLAYQQTVPTEGSIRDLRKLIKEFRAAHYRNVYEPLVTVATEQGATVTWLDKMPRNGYVIINIIAARKPGMFKVQIKGYEFTE